MSKFAMSMLAAAVAMVLCVCDARGQLATDEQHRPEFPKRITDWEKIKPGRIVLDGPNNCYIPPSDLPGAPYQYECETPGLYMYGTEFPATVTIRKRLVLPFEKNKTEPGAIGPCIPGVFRRPPTGIDKEVTLARTWSVSVGSTSEVSNELKLSVGVEAANLAQFGAEAVAGVTVGLQVSDTYSRTVEDTERINIPGNPCWYDLAAFLKTEVWAIKHTTEARRWLWVCTDRGSAGGPVISRFVPCSNVHSIQAVAINGSEHALWISTYPCKPYSDRLLPGIDDDATFVEPRSEPACHPLPPCDVLVPPQSSCCPACPN